MLAASSPPPVGRRGRSEDDWSLITPGLLEEPCSPGFSIDDRRSDGGESDLSMLSRPNESLAEGVARNFFEALNGLSRTALPGEMRPILTRVQQSSTSTLAAEPAGMPSSASATFPYSLDQDRAHSAQLWIENQHMPACEGEDPLDLPDSPHGAWNQTEQLARDIRQASIGVAEVKAPSVDRYMKVVVVGQPGLGKTTFVDNIRASFGQLESELSPALSLASHPSITNAFTGTLHEVRREDGKGNKFHYFLQDTKGFCTMDEAAPLLDAIKTQSESYFKTEQDGKRSQPMAQLLDPRVDVCIYFVPPHAIYPLDIDTMGRISQLVPVIPVIAKADTMTPGELAAFRGKLSKALSDAGVTVHKFKADDAILAGLSTEEHIFAVVGSKNIDMSVSRSWPIRNYPWGRVEALNRAHSDVPALKNLVFALAYEDFKSDTETRYLAYRKARLEGNSPPLAHKASRVSREPPFKPQSRPRRAAPSLQKEARAFTALLFFLSLSMLGLRFTVMDPVGPLAARLGLPMPQTFFESKLQQELSTCQWQANNSVPIWASDGLTELVRAPPPHGAGALAEGVLLTPAEYVEGVQKLLALLPNTTGARREDVLTIMQLLYRAKMDESRYQPPAAPETEPPRQHPGAGHGLVSGARSLDTFAHSLYKGMQSQLDTLGPLSRDASVTLSAVGRDVSSTLSAVTQDLGAVLSTLGQGAGKTFDKTAAHIRAYADSLPGVAAEISANARSLAGGLPPLPSVADISANARSLAGRLPSVDVDALRGAAGPAVEGVKSGVAESTRAVSSWVSRTTRDTGLGRFLVPQTVANETVVIDVRRILRRFSMILAFI